MVLLRLTLVLVLLQAGSALAQHAYSDAVQRACASDYKQYCREYGIETEALRLCMDRVAQKLTKTCVDALVADGEISKRQVEVRQHGGN
jgi:hypothetical protein